MNNGLVPIIFKGLGTVPKVSHVTPTSALDLRRTKLTINYIPNLAQNPAIPAYHAIFSPKNNSLKPLNTTPLQRKITESLSHLNLTFPNIPKTYDYTIPPWKINHPQINLDLTRYPKEATHAETYKKAFLKLNERYKRAVKIYTDGSKTDETTGAAFITPSSNFKYHLPQTSSIYSAELYSLKKASEYIKNMQEQEILICTDSLSVIHSITKMYSTNYFVQNIQENLHKALEEGKQITIVWVPSHRGIEGNNKADEAARSVLGVPLTNIPTSAEDFKTSVRKEINRHWTSLWQNTATTNKLRQLKDDTTNWPTTGSRRDQVVLTRLRIGHTLLTHQHIFKREEPPTCNTCNTKITVEHIITKCTIYDQHRQKHNIPHDIHVALSNNNTIATNIIQYLKDTQIYNKL